MSSNSTMLSALIEWRDARKAIFDKPLSDKSKEHWQRLSVAEHKLMEVAEALGNCCP